MKLNDDININYRIGSPSEEWIKKEADGIHAIGYREGYKQAESDYKKKLDDIKAEIDELDFDFGDFYEYDHTEEIHEMIDKVWNKHIGKK